MNKKVLFILGMHRSGTSALAGAIHHGGIMGGQALIDPAFDNVKGFFENKSAVLINEAILADWGLSWDSPFNLPAAWTSDSRMQQHKNAIRHFLDTELAAASLLYLKDPRLCYLLPLWQEVLASLEIESFHIITLRRPEEVCSSLKRRNEMERNKALSLWLNHSLLAEKNTRGYPRRFISYSEFIASPLETIAPILEAFQLMPDEGEWQSRRQTIQAFVDKKLRHHDAAILAGFALEELPFYGQTAALLNELIALPDDKVVLSKLDAIKEAYQFNLSFFTPKAKDAYFAILKPAPGETERMLAPLRIAVFAGLGKLVFNLPTRSNTTAFHVFPCDGVCLATLHSVSIHYEDGSTDTVESPPKKVLLEHGNKFLFGKTDYIVVEPDLSKIPDCITLYIRYDSIGEAAIEGIHDLGANIKDWLYGQLQEKENLRIHQTDEWSEKWRLASEQASNIAKVATENEIRFAQQKNALEDRAKQLEDRGKQLEDRGTQLEVRGKQLEDQIKQLEDQTKQLEDRGKQLEDQAKQLEDRGKQLENRIVLTLDNLQDSESRHEKTLGLLQNETATSAALKAQTEADLRRIAAFQEKIKEKDHLIWDVFSKAQKTERDYQRSQRTLEDLRTSMSYRLGWALTSPFRLLYDLCYSKPVNQTSLWLFFQFAATGLKMPGRMLSNINGTNLKTLRKAWGKESPREIAANLVKLLSGNRASAVPDPPRQHEPSVPTSSTLALPKFHVPNGSDVMALASLPETEKKTYQHRKTVIFMSPNLPDFDGSSGGKRATRMLALLAEECEVYAFTLGNKPEKHIKKLEESGVRVFRSDNFDDIKRLVPQVDVLIYSFFYSFFDGEKLMSLYPKAKVIVDSVDVHWVRHERSRGLWQELTDEIIQTKKELEIKVYSEAEIVWTVTEQDRQAVLAEVPHANVHIVSNVHSPEVATYRDPGNNQLLFIGGFSHYPNILAVRELVFHIFPKIKEQVWDATLVIAGSNAPQEIVDLGRLPDVEFLGFVEDSQLPALYQNSFLALAPLQAGAGIKGKICEAIAFKVPVVTNSIGNEGIELINEFSGLIADNNEDLVQLTVNALQRTYDLDKMTRLAQTSLLHLVGPQTVKKNMLQSLSSQEVSICIVTWNKMSLLQRCIESIENHTHGIRYKVLVYSNGCTDGTRQYLEAAAKINPDIIPILSDTNDVFVIPNNRMMRLFPENDVVLLNNDTYVTEGWLQALREAAYSAPDIGITGAKLLYPDGRLQEFGSELYASGSGRNIGKFDDPSKEEYLHPKFAGYVSGCVFYVKRSTIDQIGVFDEAFHPCYCEDSDYCYTAWEHGIATMVTPASLVYHDEGGTSGTDVNTGFKAYQKVNFEKFLKKHGPRLEETATKIKLKNLAGRPISLPSK